MDILRDILETILGQNEDRTNQKQPNSTFEQPYSTFEQPKTTFSQEKTPEQQECDNETTIEQEIIKCQRLHGRLLISTSRKLRKRFGEWSYILGKYRCETVDRVINRFAKQRQRGNCPVKAQIKEEEKTPKEIINHYFKEKYKAEYQAL
uniref:Uncharacterized protein n=1 Tax=uncultured marine thaumarchaeote KM3_53_F08 TaxID=1456186 RepID=A0A075H740_9ARCH|nr:hypothetical protein [uncultured marine thaumarchaeote KM3_53_F08]